MTNRKSAATGLSKKQADHINGLETTSSKIRYLTAEGLTRSQIAKVLNIRYQWVRNVQITPLKGQ